MGKRDALRRVKKYQAKVEPEVVRKRFAKRKKAIVDQMTAYFNEIYEVEEKASAVLNQEDAPITFTPSYLCYARELWRLQKKYAGKRLFREIRVCEEKREEKRQRRGLDQKILENLRVKIFGIELP